jgi:hypothetical protein
MFDLDDDHQGKMGLREQFYQGASQCHRGASRSVGLALGVSRRGQSVDRCFFLNRKD